MIDKLLLFFYYFSPQVNLLLQAYIYSDDPTVPVFRVLESGGRLEKLIAQVDWSPAVKFPQSVMIWGAMSSASVGPLCWSKTNVTAPVYQEIVEHLMLPSADQLFKDADFIFEQIWHLRTLPRAPKVG